MHPITSPQNSTYKKLLSLTSAKGLKKEGLFLLSGKKLVREFLAKPKLEIAYELVSGKLKPLTGKGKAAEILELSKPLFDEIDCVGTHYNILVLRQPGIEKVDAEKLKNYKPSGLEVILPVGDPGNLGALLRSCEAFGVSRVILTEEAAHPFLPKTVKASAGSVMRLPLMRGPALSVFPDHCIALDAAGISIDGFSWPKNSLLAVGEEGAGLGKTKFKQRLSIPTHGVESLNAVVAASIALFDYSRKRR